MRVIDVEQGTPEWHELRRGKISGTMLGDLYSKTNGRKIGFYQIIAERIGLDPEIGVDRMQRGLDLEEAAAQLFTEKTGIKTIVAGICVSDLDDSIIQSPDRLIKKGKKYTGAVEIKCLSPARHLQAVIENRVPPEFEAQKIQYFVVNDDLKVLYFVFYDPRIPSVPLHIIEVHRKDVQDKIDFFKDYQIQTLREIEEIVERLAF